MLALLYLLRPQDQEIHDHEDQDDWQELDEGIGQVAGPAAGRLGQSL
jgi:hypothetical protein